MVADLQTEVELIDTNEDIKPLPVPKPSIHSPLARLLLKHNLAKTERQAITIILLFVILIFILTLIFIYVGNVYGPPPDFLPPAPISY